MVGKPEPLGAHLDPQRSAVNFAVFSASASAVSLCLFTEDDLRQGRVTHEIQLNPEINRTGDIWHVMVPRIQPGMLYGFRVTGDHQSLDPTAPGHRFDPAAVVLDPYAETILSRRTYGEMGPQLAYGSEGVLGLMPTWPQAASFVPSAEDEPFDWEGDRPLNLPMEQLVIYEMHVRGFTQDPRSGVKGRGTYEGMVEKLDYLQKLGVNALELLPVQEFNELEYYTPIPGSDQYRYNFWGYSTVGYFAPMSRFSQAAAEGKGGNAIKNEFKTLIKECHKRGMEVILDVVFNHTAEGNEKGPTLSFRGLDNRIYYMMAPGGEYYNYSGCGNTLNCNQPVVRQFILDCLKYWVEEYHVDGFRFDLASILTRAHSAWHPDLPAEEPKDMEVELTLDESFEGTPVIVVPPAPPSGPIVSAEGGYMTDGAGQATGTPLPDPPLIQAISEDPVLRNTKMIAEAWDCDGLNQVGAFPHYGGRWAEWNGRFRDVVRNFIKGTDGNWAGDFASVMCGSPNVYAEKEAGENDWWGRNGGKQWRGSRGPTASINFITAHDGFTLADLVSYNEKHNEANGEQNRDGESHNNSWNCGEEGPTTKWEVQRLRQRQMRNHVAALLLAHGVPMVLMGDEYGHSKGGNNNTYCHDSMLNWLNWQQAEEDAYGLSRFMRLMIGIRSRHSQLQRTKYVNQGEIEWHGVEPLQPDWSETSRLVAFTQAGGSGSGIYVAFNTSHKAIVLKLPKWGGRIWQPLVDTSKVSPYDVLVADEALSQEELEEVRGASSMWAAEGYCAVLPWSCVVLESVPEAEFKHPLKVPRSSFYARRG